MKTNHIKHGIVAALFFAALGLSLNAQTQAEAAERAVVAPLIAKAQKGDVDAQRRLGYLYGEGKEGVKQDYNEARRWLELAAQGGHVEAMISLGWLYYNGLGVTQDYAKAAEWYRKGAELGNATSMHNLAHLYYEGNGVEEDREEALNLFLTAALLGHKPARKSLEQGFPFYGRYIERVFKAVGGDVEASYELGYLAHRGSLYRDGRTEYGRKQDYDDARRWYELAAQGGHAEAMYELGVLYTYGLGVAQDYAKAAEWYRKGAELGNATSMNYLGDFYLDGTGVEKDRTKAREWLMKAAKLGENRADDRLRGEFGFEWEYIEKFIEPVERSVGEALIAKAEEGDADAQFELGLAFKEARVLSAAASWLRKAANQGHPEAPEELDDVMSDIADQLISGLGGFL